VPVYSMPAMTAALAQMPELTATSETLPEGMRRQ
jgi:hypothetical protein